MTIGRAATTDKRVTELEKRLVTLEAELAANKKIVTNCHFYLKALRNAILATDGKAEPVAAALHQLATQSGQLATGD